MIYITKYCILLFTTIYYVLAGDRSLPRLRPGSTQGLEQVQLRVQLKLDLELALHMET